ncbi:MAG: hypothetical protein J5486_05945 [Bacteroidaceae bacterium]|nr:hypothetical protein [Bacteroidaceae bacterium]
MTENINEVLGVSQTSISDTNPNEVKTADNSAENTLATIAIIVLILGIIATFICLFTLCFVEVPKSMYSTKTEFSPSGFATTVMVLLSSLISWSVMTVLSNISLTLKDINSKIKGEEKPEIPNPQASKATMPKGKSKEERIAELKPLVESSAISQQELDDLIKEEFKES